MELTIERGYYQITNKDEMYENIVNSYQSDIYLDSITLLDNNSIKINLHTMGLYDKNINNIKIKFISKKINDKNIISQNIINNTLTNAKYSLSNNYTTIIDDNFVQDENLLIFNIIIPFKIITEHSHNIILTLYDIDNISSIINDIELKITFTEIIFNDDFENYLLKNGCRQLIKTKNETFNVISCMMGMIALATSEYLPEERYIQFAQKYNYESI